jgi:hypothetical protein
VAGGVTVNENVGNFTGALGEGMELELRVHDLDSRLGGSRMMAVGLFLVNQ